MIFQLPQILTKDVLGVSREIMVVAIKTIKLIPMIVAF